MPLPLSTSVPLPDAIARPLAVAVAVHIGGVGQQLGLGDHATPLSSAIAASVTGAVAGASFTGARLKLWRRRDAAAVAVGARCS